MPTKAKTPDYRIYSLPEGERNVAKLVTVKTQGARITLALCTDGAVYTATRGNGYDLTRDWSCNDTLRRAWCKLTGHSFADLKAYRDKLKALAVKREATAELDNLKRRAAKAGYRLVKIKTPA